MTRGRSRWTTRPARGSWPAASTASTPAAPSPWWLQRRLLAAGMRPISLVVDVTNYVMLELGQPLHAYDAARLTGGIAVRRARAGETLTTLDDVERRLDPDDLLIVDDSGPIGLAGVMGGASTEIGEAAEGGTIDVVLEAAHFDPAVIARAARRHKLPSEASRRFERVVDPQLPPVAAERAARLLVEHGGGTIAAGPHGRGRRPGAGAGARCRWSCRTASPASPTRAAPPCAGCSRWAAGSSSTPGPTGTASSSPPRPRGGRTSCRPRTSWRRCCGSRATTRSRRCCRPRRPGVGSPPASCAAAPSRGRWPRPAASRCSRSPSSEPRSGTRSACPPTTSAAATVPVANPLDADRPALATTLLPGLLDALVRNRARGFTDLVLHTVEQVVLPHAKPVADAGPGRRQTARRTPSRADQGRAARPAACTSASCSPATASGGAGGDAGRPARWADAIEIGRLVGAAAGVELRVTAAALPPWHPGRCAALRVGDWLVGHAGELHPKVVEALGLPPRTCAVELDLDALPLRDDRPAPRVSPYPPVSVDVALVGGRGRPGRRADGGPARRRRRPPGGGAALRRLHGRAGGAGNARWRYALRFRAPDRTLTSEEANAARDAAVAWRRTGTAPTLR